MAYAGAIGPQGDDGLYNGEVSRRIRRAVEANPGASPEVLFEAIRLEMLAMTDSDGSHKAQEQKPKVSDSP